MDIYSIAVLLHLLSATYSIEIISESLSNLSDYKHSTPESVRQRRSYYTPKDPLYCPPCHQLHCYKHRKKRLNCKGGYTVGVCGCCRVCAKVVNEQCGGEHYYLGRCDRGLECEPLPPTEVTFHKDGIKTVYKVQKGICRKGEEKISKNLHQCKPKCDPDYCLKNPRAICSARDNAKNLKQCQGNCQHTSCRACQFFEPEIQCKKCATDDFKCLRDFGRCIRKKTCKPKTYPCGNETTVKVPKGEFICEIPECPEEM